MAIDGVMYESTALSTSTAIQGKDASQLGMDDFLNLLVAQMTNQDMMNPVNDTEFIAQMAQFSALQGIQTIQEYQLQSYAASYAGKYVTIADVNGLGLMETISGKVDAVTFYDGTPKVLVNGKTYDLHKVMEIGDGAGSGTLSEASQYINKRVTVTYKDEFDETKEITGLVTAVSLKDNTAQVIIEGTEYPAYSITKVHDEDATEESDSDDSSETSAVSTLSTSVTGTTDSDGIRYHDAISTYANTTMTASEAPTSDSTLEYIVAWAKAVAAASKYPTAANSWQEIAQSYFKDFGLL